MEKLFDEMKKEKVSSETAKAELERRIAEKLSRMSETDLDALFNLHEQQIVEKKLRERRAVVGSGALIEGQISFTNAHQHDPDYELYYRPYTAYKKRQQAGAFYKFASGRTLEVCGRFFKNTASKILSFFFFIFFGIFTVIKMGALKIARVFKKIRFLSIIVRGADRLAGAIACAIADAVRAIFFKPKRVIVNVEHKISSGMAHIITKLDKRNDVIAKKAFIAVVKSNRRVHWARELADIHKRKLLAGLLVLITAAITTVSVTNYFTAYVYAYNGRALGMVKNQEDVLRILEVVSEQLTREYGTEIEIDKDQDITFERVIAIHPEIDDIQDVFNRLTYMQDMNTKAYALYVDNWRIGILDSKERIESMLDDFKAIYMKLETGIHYESTSFAENIEVRQIDTQLGRIQNPDDILERLTAGSMSEKIHIVQKGETFSGIAKAYNISMAELEAMNPDIAPAKLGIGQEVTLMQAVPLLTVQTVERAIYVDLLPYDTVYEDSAALFKGEQSTRVKGIHGEREVTARIIRNNGFEVAREELDTRILKEPSSAVVLRGTKDPPPLQGTGKLIKPVSGYRLTSSFGNRGGRMHYGIDMALAHGSRIGAADGGTVVFSGYRSSFGYVIEIDHGGNMKTLYAHCSALHVKKGDKVYQGQHIANVGSTGRSTGPHLHFEVHINGVPKNPMSYL